MILRFLRTVRYLSPGQIAAQCRLRTRRLFDRPGRFARRHAPPRPACRWEPRTGLLPPGPQDNLANDLAEGRLTFLDLTHHVGFPPCWRQDDLPKLWQYNLHYFEYLWALDFDQARAVVSDWIANHPLAHGRMGWEPYPTSLRLMNWCGVFFGRLRRQTEADERFPDELWPSLFSQAQWLAANLEAHVRGNHLLENAAALVTVGSCFAGPAPRQWLAKGLDVLTRELGKQVLGDGGHFERSPMYHSRVVYVLLTLANVGPPPVRALAGPLAGRMLDALAAMCHGDGRIALLNDSAFGIYNTLDELRSHAAAIGLSEPAVPAADLGDRPTGAFALADTGYYGYRGDSGHYLICDAAPIGPDYVPGHAHGDLLSFELSLAGSRAIVDSGVYDYTSSPMRRYCRSTAAHNTVTVASRDQCEFWATFRVARRGRPHVTHWAGDEAGMLLTAWHDGYLRLPCRARHERGFRFHAAGVLMLRDRVDSRRDATSQCRFHLHPDCTVASVADGCVEVTFPGGTFWICSADGATPTVETASYCPRFGHKIPNEVVVFTAAGRDVSFRTCIALARARPVLTNDGADVDGQLFRW